MAYIAKVTNGRGQRSPFWHVFWKDAEGRLHHQSTKTTSRAEALEVAHGTRVAVKHARIGRLTPDVARAVMGNVVSDILCSWTGAPLERYTVRQWLETWLASKKQELVETSFVRYRGIVQRFIRFLGSNADKDLASLSTDLVVKFRDELVSKLSANSAYVAVKMLKGCWSDAVKRGLLTTNPLRGVKPLPVSRQSARRPFTIDEWRKVLTAAHGTEWEGLTMLGLYTAQRLADLAHLRWRQFEPTTGELNFITGKTGRTVCVPLPKDALDYLGALTAPDNPDAYVFPKAAQTATSALSKQFYAVLVDVGIAKARPHDTQPDAPGRSGHRETSPLTFHSLRHTTTTLLKAAGVGDAIVRDFIGHESTVISQRYTHLDSASLRKALDHLPQVKKA